MIFFNQRVVAENYVNLKFGLNYQFKKIGLKFGILTIKIIKMGDYESISDAIVKFGVMIKKANSEFSIRPGIVGIGERLNDRGGYNAMFAVASLVREKNRLMGRELEFAWDGIGTWQA